MADGTFAVLMFVLGLTDMNQNHCGTEAGCLGRSSTEPRLHFSVGEVLERRAQPASELYVRYDFGHKNGPFGHALGLSVGENGETWFGVGQTWRHDFGSSPLYTELHAMTGLYFDNGGFDLGGPIAFRSGIEVGYALNNGWNIALGYDHRSNAGIYDKNPGIETVQLKLSIPTR